MARLGGRRSKKDLRLISIEISLIIGVLDMNNKNEKGIDYYKILDGAAVNALKKIFKIVEKDNGGNLPGEHHFYISFFTKYPGASLPDFLLEEFPEKMTIVIQHMYSNFKVDSKNLSVTLSFEGKPSDLVIPLHSIILFNDPSKQFTLSFTKKDPKSDNNEVDIEEDKDDDLNISYEDKEKKVIDLSSMIKNKPE